MDVVLYGEKYNLAMQGIEDMIFSMGDPLPHFKREVYQQSFETYVGKYTPVIEAIEAVYTMDEQPERWLEKLTQHIIELAAQTLDSISKKSLKAQRQIELNMTMAVFLLPAMLEKPNTFAEPFTDMLVEEWNKTFKTTIGKSKYDKIEDGFKSKLCYITTAACEYMNKPDDCYELNVLREYRDTYLLGDDMGEELVREYYNIAPTIVTRINKSEDAKTIYTQIWEKYLTPCIQMIEADEKEACKDHYQAMVYDLKGRYMA